MTVSDVLNKFQQLIDEGHAEEEVYLDTGPHNLFTIGDIDLDADEFGIIIWKE